jgi:hypothetical protein
LCQVNRADFGGIFFSYLHEGHKGDAAGAALLLTNAED